MTVERSLRLIAGTFVLLSLGLSQVHAPWRSTSPSRTRRPRIPWPHRPRSWWTRNSARTSRATWPASQVVFEKVEYDLGLAAEDFTEAALKRPPRRWLK